jgi:hypothetical protein
MLYETFGGHENLQMHRTLLLVNGSAMSLTPSRSIIIEFTPSITGNDGILHAYACLGPVCARARFKYALLSVCTLR